jgi:hypothetical protein
MKPPIFIRITVLLFFMFYSFQPVLMAQSANYLEDEGSSLWEEQQFLDVTGEEFATEDAQYVGEEDITAAQEAARRAGIPSIDLASALEREKEMLPDNIMYGIGTGAMLGGWFALVMGEEARENVRFLTVGTLVGALLGVAVGYKSLFMSQRASLSPELQRLQPDWQMADNETGSSITPYLAITPQSARFDLQIRF